MNMVDQSVDIIIPCLRDSLPLDELDRCVKNIQKYTDNYNLILVTTDKSQPYNINQGLDRAKSKYIAILDWDVYVSKDWLSKLVEVLHTNKEVGIIGPKMTGIYQHWDGLSSKVELPKPQEWLTLPGGCMVFRNIGLRWDEKFPSGYWADTDFCRQYKDKGYKINIHGGVEVEHDLYQSQDKELVNPWMAQGEKIYEEKWGDTDY